MKQYLFPELGRGIALAAGRLDDPINRATRLLADATKVDAPIKSLGSKQCSCGVSVDNLNVYRVRFDCAIDPTRGEVEFSTLFVHLMAYHRHELDDECREFIGLLMHTSIASKRPSFKDLFHPPAQLAFTPDR